MDKRLDKKTCVAGYLIRPDAHVTMMDTCLVLICDVHDSVVFHFHMRITNRADSRGHRMISI